MEEAEVEEQWDKKTVTQEKEIIGKNRYKTENPTRLNLKKYI